MNIAIHALKIMFIVRSIVWSVKMVIMLIYKLEFVIIVQMDVQYAFIRIIYIKMLGNGKSEAFINIEINCFMDIIILIFLLELQELKIMK